MLLQDPPVADRFTTSSNGGKPRFHIAIVGAGLGGLSAAIGISRAGHRVTILEQAAQLGEVCHKPTVLISPLNVQLIVRIGRCWYPDSSKFGECFKTMGSSTGNRILLSSTSRFKGPILWNWQHHAHSTSGPLL